MIIWLFLASSFLSIYVHLCYRKIQIELRTDTIQLFLFYFAPSLVNVINLCTITLLLKNDLFALYVPLHIIRVKEN